MDIETLSFPVFFFFEVPPPTFKLTPGGIFFRKKTPAPGGNAEKSAVFLPVVVAGGAIAANRGRALALPTAVLLVPLKLFLVMLFRPNIVGAAVCEVCVLCFSEDPPGTFPPFFVCLFF